MTPLDQDAITQALDGLIRAIVPEVSLVPKYGGTLYTLRPDEKEGQFCGIFPYKAHVQLAFSEGTALQDPAGALEGTGKLRRHVNFSALEGIDAEVVSALLVDAVDVSRARP